MILLSVMSQAVNISKALPMTDLQQIVWKIHSQAYIYYHPTG